MIIAGISLLQYANVKAAAAQKEYTSNIIDLKEVRDQLLQTVEHLKEAQKILELEPPGSTEQHWILEAREELEQVENVLLNFPAT